MHAPSQHCCPAAHEPEPQHEPAGTHAPPQHSLPVSQVPEPQQTWSAPMHVPLQHDSPSAQQPSPQEVVQEPPLPPPVPEPPPAPALHALVAERVSGMVHAPQEPEHGTAPVEN